jgi:xylulokinase
VFVPYLSGERAPLWDQDVRALFLGLSDEHGPEELAAAVLGGVLCSARHVLDVVEQATGAAVREIEVVGRGVGDAAFESAALRVLGSGLRFHDDADMSARGAAMLAAAVGGWPLGEAVGRLGDATRTAQPAPGDLERSARLMARYTAASEVARSWSARMAKEAAE